MYLSTYSSPTFFVTKRSVFARSERGVEKEKRKGKVNEQSEASELGNKRHTSS